MLMTYFPVLIIEGFVIALAVSVLFVNSIVSPKTPFKGKLLPWECGMEPIGSASAGHFRIHFFIVAILFIVFDVETVFLFPWAVVLRSIGGGGFFVLVVFFVFFLCGLF